MEIAKLSTEFWLAHWNSQIFSAANMKFNESSDFDVVILMCEKLASLVQLSWNSVKP